MSGLLSALPSSRQKSNCRQDDSNATTLTHDSIDVFYERPRLVISITNPESSADTGLSDKDRNSTGPISSHTANYL
jgi:hypothetical protein